MHSLGFCSIFDMYSVPYGLLYLMHHHHHHHSAHLIIRDDTCSGRVDPFKARATSHRTLFRKVNIYEVNMNKRNHIKKGPFVCVSAVLALPCVLFPCFYS
jgi:hypothetical protein